MRNICLLCSPSILGFTVFLFSFPLDRHLPFHLSWTVFDAFFVFFLVAPMFTLIAFVLTIRRAFASLVSSKSKVIAWAILALTIAINVFTVIGILAAAYY